MWARTLGSPLEAGHQLDMDLQRTYLVVIEVYNWQQDKDSSEPTQQQANDNSEPILKQQSQKQDDYILMNIERLDKVLESG